jgi:DNA-binding CsgD family transcriptional regulator
MDDYDASIQGIDLREITERNLEVWRLIKKGKTPAEIGVLLGISLSAVRKHIARVMDITGRHTQAGALAVLMARKRL